MKSRAGRLALLLIFLGALGVTAYLFHASESSARSESAAAIAFTALARQTERQVLDLRASQQAYVAAGQGGEFWTKKVDERLTGARAALAAMRAAAGSAPARSAVEQAESSLQDFTQVDSRAREYARTGQKLLASDLIYTNGVELTDGALAAIQHAESVELQARTVSAATFDRRQLFALAAAAAASVLAVLLLLPVITVAASIPVDQLVLRAAPVREDPVPAGSDASEDGWSSARRVSHSLEAAEPASATEADGATVPAVAPSVPDPATFAAPDRPAVAETPATARAFQAASVDLRGIASLCTQLSRVPDTLALTPLLERAAGLLDANGIILWIADPDGRELNPVVAQGYPAQLVARLGTIPRDAENATAAAFRTSLLQTVRADGPSNGAIAAPLVTSGGCVGVMAAEVKHEGEREDAKLATATIVAAQLASLVGPPAARAQNRIEAAGA
jgi:GAF domain-containing protein